MLAQLAIPGWLYYSMLMGADLASTKVGQSRGCVEGNPVVGGNTGRQVVAKGLGFTLAWGGEKMARDHRKVKLGMRVGLGGLVGFAVIHNLTVNCRGER